MNLKLALQNGSQMRKKCVYKLLHCVMTLVCTGMSCAIKTVYILGHGPFSHVYDIAVEEYFRELESNEDKKDFIKQNSEDVDDEDIKLPKVVINNCQFCIDLCTYMQEARHEYRSALIVGQLLEKLPFEKLNKDHVKLIESMITFSEV